MGDVFDDLRDEIAELRKLIFAARDRGIAEDDPEIRALLRTLHARQELLERLEQPDRDPPDEEPVGDARSPVSTLLGDLREGGGFDASLAPADGALRVPAKDLSREQVEWLAAMVDRHGAHMSIDQRGVFTIWFDRDGPEYPTAS